MSRKMTGLPKREKLKNTYDRLHPVCEEALLSLHGEIRRLLQRRGYSPTIKYRVKSFSAYCDKLLRNERRGPEGNPAITDLLGLRLICPFLEDLDQVEKLICDHFDVVETVRKGAEHSFREFGYDSLHLVIRLPNGLLPTPPPATRRVCEIQLRTILQDAWAEVEHELIYKSDINLPNDSIRRKLASLNATLTLSDLIFQEIRDFQRAIKKRGQRRRQVMNATLFEQQPIFIASPPRDRCLPQEPTDDAEVPVLGGTELERAMFEALQAHSNNELQTAVDLYSQLLRMKLPEPVRALVYNHRGMARFAQGRYRDALHDFSASLDWDEGNVRSLNNRALTLRVLKKHDRSLADYNRSLDIDPNQVDGYWGRAQTCYEMKLFSRALADCMRVTEIDPDHRPARQLEESIRRQVF